MLFHNLIAQAQSTPEQAFLDKIEPNVLGAVMILGVIFGFVLLIVTIVSVFGTIEKITLARMSRNMVDEMLAKGYSPQEIRLLVEGDTTWNKFRKFLGLAKNQVPPQPDSETRPRPPVKQTSI